MEQGRLLKYPTSAARSDERPGAPRRTQAERSSATRERIIRATLDLLHLHGYSAASTIAVARHAGLSLGALQHQFPTKALLMASVARRFAARRFLVYRSAIKGATLGIERFEALTKASWSMIGTKELAASMEIELAMRNDPELAAVVAPAFARHTAFVRRLLARFLENSFPKDDSRIESIRLLNNALLFGLSLELIRQTPQDSVDRAIGEWQRALAIIVRQ
jgi:AcrR family transcriptional regulator